MPHENKLIRTNEGVAALNNAIQFLERQPPVPAFQRLSQGLSRSAQDLVVDNGPQGLVGNSLSDGTQAKDRWVRYGQWSGKIGENIAYVLAHPTAVVLQWIIDDGNINRPHRLTLFDQQFTVVGIANGAHSMYGHMTVVEFAHNFVDGERGKAPEVGTRAAPGVTTRAATDRKTQEGVLGSQDQNYVIETDHLDCATAAPLQLVAKDKVLTLSHTFSEGGKAKKKNFQWQLPFAFNPASVNARFVNQKVVITLPKPSTSMDGGSGSTTIGTYLLPAGSSNPSPNVDVKQANGKFVLTAFASSFDENVTIDYNQDVVSFTFTHIVSDPHPRNVSTAQPLRMPFVLSRELFNISGGQNSIIVTIDKPAARGADVIIPIY